MLWKTKTLTNPKNFHLQQDVAHKLKSMELKPVKEYRASSGYSIDALVEEVGGRLIGTAVDGPTATTMLKHRQMQEPAMPIARMSTMIGTSACNCCETKRGDGSCGQSQRERDERNARLVIDGRASQSFTSGQRTQLGRSRSSRQAV